MSELVAKRLENIEDLPTIPNTLQRVLTSIDEVTTSAQSMEEIIREDPVLTAKILKIANSPYYGLATEVSSIARAVVILGFDEVKNLVIGLSLTGAFSGGIHFPGMDGTSVWIHSFAVAQASKMVGEIMETLDPDELFTAGLLHDIGRVLMCLYFPEELNEIIALQDEGGLSLNEAEKSFGLSHTEVGAYLAKKWNLSDMLLNVIRYHHHPQGAGHYETEAAAVFLADELCHALKIGFHHDDQKKILVPKCLNFGADTVKLLAKKLKEQRDAIEESWRDVLTS